MVEVQLFFEGLFALLGNLFQAMMASIGAFFGGLVHGLQGIIHGIAG